MVSVAPVAVTLEAVREGTVAKTISVIFLLV